MTLKYPKQYRFRAIDCTRGELVDETFTTLNALVEKHGKQFDITRRRCDSIRKRTRLACRKYKHMHIEETYVKAPPPPPEVAEATEEVSPHD